MSKITSIILFVLIINCKLSIINCFSQSPPNCPAIATSCCAAIGSGSTFSMSPNDPSDNKTITFDSFGEYLSGIAEYGATTLRLTVATGPGANPPCTDGCRWKLRVYEDNLGAPSTQWETVTVYGSGSGTKPTVNMLQFRIRNACNTSRTGTGFVDIVDADNINDVRCIIDNNCPDTNPVDLDFGVAPDHNSADPCGTTDVNGAGSYLTNSGDYTFIIDYQIKPALTLAAGMYRITVRYCLSDGN